MIKLFATIVALTWALACAAPDDAEAPLGELEQNLGSSVTLNSVPSTLGFFSYIPGKWPGVPRAQVPSGWTGYPGLLPDRLPVYVSVIPRSTINCTVFCGGASCGSCLAGISQADYDAGIAAWNAALNAVFNATQQQVYFLDATQFGQNPDVTFYPGGSAAVGGDLENHLWTTDGRYTGRQRCGDGTNSWIRPVNGSGPLRGVCTRGFTITSYIKEVLARYDEYAAFWCLNITRQQYLNAHVTHQLLHYLGYAEDASAIGTIMSDLEPSSYAAASAGCPYGTMQWSSSIRNLSFQLLAAQQYFNANTGTTLPE